MKVFETPQMEIIHFGRTDIMTVSPGCDCDACLPCEEGSNDCTYYDLCNTYCRRDTTCSPNNPTW